MEELIAIIFLLLVVAGLKINENDREQFSEAVRDALNDLDTEI